MICFLLKTLQAVGSLEAKATGAFRRMAAKRMPNRRNKYGLKRFDILPFLLMISAFQGCNSGANKPSAKNVSIYQRVLTQFGGDGR
jgi:hypothetical protein